MSTDFDTFSCAGCGIFKEFSAGLRNSKEIYKCYDCFTSNNQVKYKNDVTIIIRKGMVDGFDGPDWLKYLIINYDNIKEGIEKLFTTTDQANDFIESKHDYHLIIGVDGGVAEILYQVNGIHVIIFDIDAYYLENASVALGYIPDV